MSAERSLCTLMEEFTVLQRGRRSTRRREIGIVVGEAKASDYLRRHAAKRAREMASEKVTEHVSAGLPEILVLDPVEGQSHRFHLLVSREMPDPDGAPHG